jgi:hypothetical protein
MIDAHTWLYERLAQTYRRRHGLPDIAPVAEATATEPPPDGVDEIDARTAAILEVLAIGGVRPEPDESLASALARALFNEAGEPNELGRIVFRLDAPDVFDAEEADTNVG